jgi:hypothetical protein
LARFKHSEFLFRNHHNPVTALRNRAQRYTLYFMSFRLVAVHCRDIGERSDAVHWTAMSGHLSRRLLGWNAKEKRQKRKDNVMTKLTMKNVLALGVAGAITLGAASPTMALPLALNGTAVKQSAPQSAATEVRWRRGWGWGIGAGAFALGAAAASGYPYGYYDGPYPAYGPYYGYYDPYYDGPRCWRRWGRVYCNY